MLCLGGASSATNGLTKEACIATPNHNCSASMMSNKLSHVPGFSFTFSRSNESQTTKTTGSSLVWLESQCHSWRSRYLTNPSSWTFTGPTTSYGTMSEYFKDWRSHNVRGSASITGIKGLQNLKGIFVRSCLAQAALMLTSKYVFAIYLSYISVVLPRKVHNGAGSIHPRKKNLNNHWWANSYSLVYSRQTWVYKRERRLRFVSAFLLLSNVVLGDVLNWRRGSFRWLPILGEVSELFEGSL